jgi:hypothetical protein
MYQVRYLYSCGHPSQFVMHSFPWPIDRNEFTLYPAPCWECMEQGILQDILGREADIPRTREASIVQVQTINIIAPMQVAEAPKTGRVGRRNTRKGRGPRGPDFAANPSVPTPNPAFTFPAPISSISQQNPTPAIQSSGFGGLQDSVWNPSTQTQGHEIQDSIVRKSNLKKGENGNLPKTVRFEEPEKEAWEEEEEL